MRKRMLFAGLALAAAVVLGSTASAIAAPAQAQATAAPAQVQSTASPAQAEPPKGLNKVSRECFEILSKGGSLDDCQKAPSPILPPTNELVWGIISFVLIFLLLRKLAWPAIKKSLDDRAQRIKKDLDDAEATRTEAETVLGEYQGQLADARNEAARIIEDARQTADAMKADLQARADAEITDMRQRAAADIESAKARALTDLRTEVATLAIGAAEQVVGRNLDHDTNAALVEDYIDSVGAAT